MAESKEKTMQIEERPIIIKVDEKTTLKHDGLIDFDFCLECGAVAPEGPGGPCPKCDQFVADGVVQC